MAPRKPPTAVHYTPRDVALVRSACLTLATYLGSFLEDLVVVGGLVPTLLIPPDEKREPHVGTQDLDLGLSLALLEEARYVELVAHLHSANFEPDQNEAGKPANHRWKHRDERVTVDFLMAPSGGAPASNAKVACRPCSQPVCPWRSATGSASCSPARPFAARRPRALWVCGPGAFLVLKALAFRGRGEPKDAYDLLYVLENFGTTYVSDVANVLRPLLDNEPANDALVILKEDFSTADRPGPMRAAEFLGRSGDAAFRADKAGAVNELLRSLGR